MRPSCDRTGDLQEEGHSPPADTEKWPSPETESLEPICYPRIISYNRFWCLTKAHGAPNSTLQGRKQGSERCGKHLPMSPNMAGTPKSAGFFLAYSLSFMSLQNFSAFWFFFFVVVVHLSGAESWQAQVSHSSTVFDKIITPLFLKFPSPYALQFQKVARKAKVPLPLWCWLWTLILN